MTRLLLLAHGVTSGTRALLFGDRTELDREPEVRWPSRIAGLASGPEPACVATARASGLEPEVTVALAGLDAGRWSGRTLDQVAAEDPDGLRSWLTEPEAAPHGGESLAALIRRVGRYCDERDWPAGTNVAVVTPLVGRAGAVHGLGGRADLVFRIDLAPLGRVELSGSPSHWRLQGLGLGR